MMEEEDYITYLIESPPESETIISVYDPVTRLVYIPTIDMHILQFKCPNGWQSLCNITSEVFVNMLAKHYTIVQGESELKEISP